MTPYVVFLTLVTGHVRLEAKSAVNYAIGARIQQGMGYVEAADGVGPSLQEVGAELGDGYWYIHRNVPDPSLHERLAFALRAAPLQLREIAKAILSRHYGTPIMLVVVLIGVARAVHNRHSALVRNAILLAVLAAHIVALASVAHFWPRYAAPFAPFMAIWGAAGMVLCADVAIKYAPWLLQWPARAVATSVFAALVGAISIATIRELRANAEDPRPLAATGHTIAQHDPQAHTIMSVSPLVAYYAGDVWNALPWGTSNQAAAYLRLKRPDLVVLEPRGADRPYLAEWRRHGIPGVDVPVAYMSPGAPDVAILVYDLNADWNPTNAAAATNMRSDGTSTRGCAGRAGASGCKKIQSSSKNLPY